MALKTTVKTKILEPSYTLGGHSRYRRLPIQHYSQEQNLWCWAACAQMIGEYFGNTSLTQCQLASHLHNDTTCCINPSSATCNKACGISKIGRVLSHIGLSSNYVKNPIDFVDICEEIDNNRPIEVGILYDNGGHAVIIIGYLIRNSQEKVYFNDPKLKRGAALYSDFLNAGGYGRWRWTWNNINQT